MLATSTEPVITYRTSSGDHTIATITGNKPGPTLIVVGSLHGNEPAGAIAARRIVPELHNYKLSLAGEVVLCSGNTRALQKKIRYVDADLNRVWTRENIARLRTVKRGAQINSEEHEALELLDLFDKIADRARGELYYLDLHTMSASGVPFATVGDTLRNRKFALNFPTTIVLGLEEQIEGTMLEYVNNLGAVTMGFEAGQHEAVTSVAHDVAVIWIALVAAGLLRRETTPEFAQALEVLKQGSGGARIVEVRHRHPISPRDEFTMQPDFRNFQAVKRGQILAKDINGPVRAIEKGMVLLPLYQKLGDDGFFLGRTVKPFWLKLSAILRSLKVGDFVHHLPGVRRHSQDGRSFVVDTRIARILPLQVFHLLGFRKRRWSRNELIVSRRRYDLLGPLRQYPKETTT